MSYVNLPAVGSSNTSSPYPQSPRTRIRTFVPGGSSHSNSTKDSSTSSSTETVREAYGYREQQKLSNQLFQRQESLASDEYDGSGEALMSTSKTKEELYIEAKDILAMLEQQQQRNNQQQPMGFVGSSPGSTQPRRPPRSKHDRDPNSPAPLVRCSTFP